jgi:uncharacterized protein (DUF488 family)
MGGLVRGLKSKMYKADNASLSAARCRRAVEQVRYGCLRVGQAALRRATVLSEHKYHALFASLPSRLLLRAGSHYKRPMIFNRQKSLLALLDAHGGVVGNLDFQKLLFLYCQDLEERPSYDFVPYKFGGFSFTSYADKRRLIDHGLLVESERNWVLSPQGRAAADVSVAARTQMRRFALDHAKLRGDALVAHAYRRYPYFAIRSEIAGRVLQGDTKALRAIKNAQPNPTKGALSTIGYEGKPLEAYLNRLLQAGVTLLCDVRRNPLSRKYGFSKSTLSKSCEGVGIAYEHIPELGIATDKRKSLTSQVDYDALFAAYERYSLPTKQHSLARILTWMNDGKHVALTCYEHAPEQCHRHRVAEALERKLGASGTTHHL